MLGRLGKYDLVGNLIKDRGGLDGLCNVSVHFGRDHWGSRGAWPPPRRRSASSALVATFVWQTDIRTRLIGCHTCTFLGTNAFHTWLVRAALAGFEGSRLSLGGTRFLGAL